MTEQSHETVEGAGYVGGAGVQSVEEARRLHHLATADPEAERDGLLTGPAHEAKYGLERAEASAEQWRAAGIDPVLNEALPEVAADPVVAFDEPQPQPEPEPEPERRAAPVKRTTERSKPAESR